MFFKRFAYASLGVLALASAFALGATVASGQAGSGFRALAPWAVQSGSAVYVLDTSNSPYGWKQLPALGFTLPPVAPSSLIAYDGSHALTDAGEGWGKVFGAWTDLGPVPTTGVERASWGQVKSRYLH